MVSNAPGSQKGRIFWALVEEVEEQQTDKYDPTLPHWNSERVYVLCKWLPCDCLGHLSVTGGQLCCMVKTVFQYYMFVFETTYVWCLMVFVYVCSVCVSRIS